MRQPARKVKRAHSAGGVVYRRSGAAASPADYRILLLQHEAGKWMLPKGTIEAGETPEAVALREVAEETGIHNVRIVRDLGEERYLFFWKTEDTYYDKTVHYYLMEFLGGEEACPQREEGFVRCDWVSVAEALERIKYKETREVVRKAEAVLAAAAAREPAEPSEVRHGPPPP
ncbi:MAG: NUDIX domain-containing protein [Bacillati bacterium ANGP1]|uniref:NUDIX domain-containing protein n=1 Tax=Candidatus Segetimicrobium genomatis TaxID=2569760 RepID=A0A537JTQ3_9BACT|nr:MAG: NUDIX domain-containing protein [Terrabacteria group bacterium ANGP1]